MKAFRWICPGALFLTSSLAFATSVDGITLTHYESLERITYSTDSQNRTPVFQKAAILSPTTMSFDAFGGSFDLELEPNTGLLSADARTNLSNDVAVYRGKLTGVPDSWVRIVVANGFPRGLIWDGRQMIAIDAPDDGLIGGDSSVIYRLADMVIEPGSMSCSNGSLGTNGAALYARTVGEMKMARQFAPGATDEMTVGVVGDFEFTSAQGANAATALVTRMNNVDGIFSAELGIQLSTQTVETFTDSNDPFTDTTDSGDLVDELGLYRQGNPAQNQHGLTHLFTGRNLDGSTVGVAYIGALCLTRFGAGLSEGNRGASTDSLIAAHEIGHNFGAPHDGQAGSACEAEAQTFLMAPSVNGSNEFSDCSKTQMADDIAAAMGVCISPLPSVDMTIGPAASNDILLGNAANITFDIVNNGTIGATNVSANVTLPSNVSLIAAAASQGSCTTNASTVSCALGNVSGSSGETITITADTVAVGPAQFVATVTSDVDDNPGNNQRVLNLTIDPAVELMISSASDGTVTVNQNTTVAVGLQNTSDLTANAVTVSIALDPGLQATSASWALGNCTVAAQQVDCAASTFASQSNSTLTLQLTGVTVGSGTYDVSVGSAEADRNPGNNSATGTVTVRDVPEDDDEGSGAAGLVFLVLAGGMLLRRRRLVA